MNGRLAKVVAIGAIALVSELLAPVFAISQPSALPPHFEVCEQTLRGTYDGEDQYTGEAYKISLNDVIDLHNKIWYGGHTMYMVLFQVWYYSPTGKRLRADSQLIRYCILANDGSLLGVESETRLR